MAQTVRNLPAVQKTWLGSVPRLGRSPGRGHGNPLQYSSLESPHGQRGLAGYRDGVAESDTTEQLSTKPHTLTNPLNLRAVRYLPPVTQLPLTYIRANFYSPLQVSPLFKSLLYSTSLCTKDLHWYLFP